MADPLAVLLPWAWAAGALATANPCGAALPAWLSYYVAGTPVPPAGGHVRSGVGVGLGMTAGVLAVFGSAGAVVSAVGAGVARVLPWVNLIVGALIAAAGALLLLRPGWTVDSPWGSRLSLRVGRVRGAGAFVAFGAAYGVASLGCSLPIFLAVTAQALAAGGFVPGLLVFVAYGAGMGTVLLALAVAVGAGRGVVLARLRGAAPYLRGAGAAGMVAAGVYLVYYQVTVARAWLGWL